MRHGRSLARSQTFQIVNITSEIIRDYVEDVSDNGVTLFPPERSLPSPSIEGETLAMPNLPQSRTDLSQSPTHAALPQLYARENIQRTNEAKLFLSPQVSESTTADDGIFLPGSEYQELHAALRSKIIDTARSASTSRTPSPDLDHSVANVGDVENDESWRLANLEPEREYRLWQNYIAEVAGWMDKFDIDRHFELVLPILAKQHAHLKYAILALSARQLELKQKTKDNSCSLTLYSHAIHLLSPLLQRRTTVVLASCVVLAVLEMLSCSPKAWRRHLDGSAALIQSLGISGVCGGLEQALFWTFARMDIAGALISSEETLIPMEKWCGTGMLGLDVQFLLGATSPDTWACHIVYLCGRVVELLCNAGKWIGRSRHRSEKLTFDYAEAWLTLYEILDGWYRKRPVELLPLMTLPQSQDIDSPFPTILFGNSPATSGNQMYHTSALLMLKYRPPDVMTTRKPQSMLWHARQICAISISNGHHGCWTNSTQPLWIAGQLMSHFSEHKAILHIYDRIERETGWSTRWRADDLQEFWGDVGKC